MEGSKTSIRPRGGKIDGATLLQVLPSLVTGGVERGTIDIAAAIVEAGGTALVASAGGPMVRELPRVGARHVELPLSTKNPVAILANAGRLQSAIETFGVELVHARSRAPAWSAWLAARRARVPFVTTFHAPYALGVPGKRLYNSVMARGDRVIAISEFIAEHLRQHYRVPPERLRVIPRGVDLERFDPAQVSAERVIQLADRWRLPDGVPLVLLPGRLTRWKGHKTLLEAAALLKEELSFVCLFVGDDQGRKSYRVELEAAIRQLGLESHVALVGECNDMPAAYKLADVVVSASSEPEGFGRVVAEAQALGRPVVVSDHGGGPEQVIRGETGFPFPPGDAVALASALKRTLSFSTGERERIAASAIAHVKAHYSKTAMCRATIAVYEELLTG